MSDDREELGHNIRRGERPPADASVVLRGGPDTLSLLRTHARRLARAYVLDGRDVFGISVFVVLDDIGPASEPAILAGKLRGYPSIYRTTVAVLDAIGAVLLPTFTRPHYTVVLPDLGELDRLAAALGALTVNPYAGGGREER